MAKGNAASKPATFLLDGCEVEARAGETIWQVAKRVGVDIPHLCYSPEPGYRADGNCRVCMVEIEGERVLAASCIRTPTPGMKVKVASDRAKTARQMVFELLISDQPDRKTSPDPQSKFWAWADRMNIGTSRFGRREALRPTAAIRPWRSISTPASSAISAFVPAAKCRSTTLSAWPAAA
jgi:formate dehydrogenase major subunit